MKLNEAIVIESHGMIRDDEVLNDVVCEGLDLQRAKSLLISMFATGVGAVGGAVAGGYIVGAATAASKGITLGVGSSLMLSSTLLSTGMMPPVGMAIIFGSAVFGAYTLGGIVNDIADYYFLSRSSLSKALVKNINKRDAILVALEQESKKTGNEKLIEKYKNSLVKLTKEQRELGTSLVPLINKAFKSGKLTKQEYDAAIQVAEAASNGQLTNIK